MFSKVYKFLSYKIIFEFVCLSRYVCMYSKHESMNVLVTVTGWYHNKRPTHCCHFLIYYASPPEFCLFLIYPQRFLLAAETPSSEAESFEQIFLTLADEVFLSYSAGIFNIPWELTTCVCVYVCRPIYFHYYNNTLLKRITWSNSAKHESEYKMKRIINADATS
jgi:hypothetical protein